MYIRAKKLNETPSFTPQKAQFYSQNPGGLNPPTFLASSQNQSRFCEVSQFSTAVRSQQPYGWLKHSEQSQKVKDQGARAPLISYKYTTRSFVECLWSQAEVIAFVLIPRTLIYRTGILQYGIYF